MTDHPHHQARPQRLEFHHPVAVVRGLLAAAAQRVEPAGEAELEIFAAWVELEDADSPPAWIDSGIEGHCSPQLILWMARNVLQAAILTLTTEPGAHQLLRAIGHLDAATAHLAGHSAAHPVAANPTRATTAPEHRSAPWR